MSVEFDAGEREHYEERAAILEFDAGYPRAVAENLARHEVLDLQKRSRSDQKREAYTYP